MSTVRWAATILAALTVMSLLTVPPAQGAGVHPDIVGTVATIYANGNISPVSAPISQSGTTYTLTASFSGSIVDDRNGSTLDGAGFVLTYDLGNQVAVTVSNASHVNITDLQIGATFSSTGIELSDSPYGNVTGNDVIAGPNLAKGVVVDGSSGSTILENRIGGSTAGISVTGSDHVMVLGNWLSDTGGIALDGVNGAVVSSNNVSKAAVYSLSVDGSSSLTINDNNLSGDSAGYSFYVESTNDLSATGNNGSGSRAGALFWECNQLTLHGNNLSGVTETASVATLVEDSTGVTLTGNDVNNSAGWGIELDQVDDGVVSHNVVDRDINGLYVDYSQNVNISSNTLAYMTDLGAEVYDVVGLAVVDNNITHAGTWTLYLEDASNVSILGNLMDHNMGGGTTFDAVYGYSLHNATLAGNNITFAFYWAILIDYSDTIVDRDNDGSWARYGGDWEYFTNNLTLEHDTFEFDNHTAIYVEDVTSANVSYNNVSWTGHSAVGRVSYSQDAVALYAESSSGVTIYRNEAYNSSGYGAWGEYDQDLQVTSNTLTSAGLDAYGQEYVTNSTIAANDGSGARGWGFWDEGSQDMAVLANNFTSAETYGGYLYADVNVTVQGNDFSRAVNDSFTTYDTSNAVITQNDLSWARNVSLNMSWSDSVLVSWNDISNSSRGLVTNASAELTFEANTFAFDPVTFQLNNSSNLLFYHNDFLDDPAYEFGTGDGNLSFDNGYPSGGNFWSNYTGVDDFSGPGQNIPGPDGIGDTPQTVSPQYEDRYPLMDRFSPHYVTFTESGALPGGTLWGVTFNGLTYTTTGTSLAVPESNAATGTFAYTVDPGPGFVSSPASGSGPSDQTNVTIPLVFTAFTYTVTFQASGLPAGTPWSVTLSAMTTGSSGTSIVFSVANGTYAYLIGGVTGYVTSTGSGSLQVSGANVLLTIPFTALTYGVTFAETGLPSGTTWSVQLGAQVLTGSGTTLTFPAVSSGTHPYTVGAEPGYTTTWSSSVTVAGASTVVTVAFVPSTSSATFTESGLGTGASWNLTVGGTTQVVSSSSVQMNLRNGTYTYSADAGVAYGAAVSGTFTVTGSSVTVPITFVAVLESVTFAESGLPLGTAWSVTVAATTLMSTSATASTTLPLGQYAYTVGAVAGFQSPSAGSVDVGAGPAVVSLTFTPLAGAIYTVTFDEVGLASGTSWNLTFDGTLGTSTGSSLTFSVPNGTYLWVAGAVPGFVLPASGTVVVEGASTIVQVNFVAMTQLVTFTEEGLTAGTSWSLNVSGTTYTSTTSVIQVPLTAGTYAYTVGAVTGFEAVSTGSITVGNEPLLTSITFTAVSGPTYAVTFTESGLPSGTTWAVQVGDQNVTSQGSTLVLHLASGTYTFVASDQAGYVVTATADFTVKGASASVTVTFTTPSSSTTNGGAGTSSVTLDALIGLAVVLAVIAVLGLLLGVRRRGGPGASTGTMGNDAGGAAAPSPPAPASPETTSSRGTTGDAPSSSPSKP